MVDISQVDKACSSSYRGNHFCIEQIEEVIASRLPEISVAVPVFGGSMVAEEGSVRENIGNAGDLRVGGISIVESEPFREVNWFSKPPGEGNQLIEVKGLLFQ